jgi:hypothetical protein
MTSTRLLYPMNRLLPDASPTAPAERSGDCAFGHTEVTRKREDRRACESGVALRLPPQSKTRASFPRLNAHTWVARSFSLLLIGLSLTHAHAQASSSSGVRWICSTEESRCQELVTTNAPAAADSIKLQSGICLQGRPSRICHDAGGCRIAADGCAGSIHEYRCLALYDSLLNN